MNDAIDRLIYALPPFRRFAWRAGRRLYCAARGEPRRNAIATNGEAYVQRCVVAAIPHETPLTAFDIGANAGEWSLSLLDALKRAKRSDSALIHAFEPVPATRARLDAALAQNPLGHMVATHPLAASDTAGRARIAVMCADGGTNSLHPGTTAGEPPGGWVDVETIDLASYCGRRQIAHLHLVKSDAEGHDLFVLRGAASLLREERIDALQFEYNARWVFSRTYLKDVFELIADLPYALARVMPEHVELIEQWRPELERFFEANYLLIRRPALNWFACRRGRFDDANTYA